MKNSAVPNMQQFKLPHFWLFNCTGVEKLCIGFHYLAHKLDFNFSLED